MKNAADIEPSRETSVLNSNAISGNMADMLKHVLSIPIYVCTGGGTSSSHAIFMFQAFIHITTLCNMFTNRLYSFGVTSSASIYLSARSHDAVKSMQSVP